MKFLNQYYLGTIVSFILAIGFFYYPKFNAEDANSFKKKYDIEEKLNNDKEHPNAEWAVQKRLENYEKNIKSLHNSMLNIVILITLGFLLLFYQPKGINVSFLSIHIPETLLYLVVIFGMLYLWSNFGLQLNAAIDSRLALNYQFQAITPDLKELSYQNQVTHVLADNSIVDNWSSHFFGIFKSDGISLGYLSHIGLYGIFGIMISVLFATINVTSIELGIRKIKLKYLSAILLVFSMALIITSTIAWVYKHKYSSRYIAFCWLVTGILILVWRLYRHKIIIKKKEPSEVKE